jgi:hypothetical protein
MTLAERMAYLEKHPLPEPRLNIIKNQFLHQGGVAYRQGGALLSTLVVYRNGAWS